MGGILHHQGDQRREARRRVAMGHATFTTHQKLLLRNRKFPLTRRLQLFQSLIISQMTFGMESWTLRTRAAQIGVHNSIMKLYKRLLDYKVNDHVSDDDILCTLEAPSPTILLRTARLRYLGLLYRNGGEDLWALVLQNQEWQELIWSDISWMYGQLWNSSSLPDPMASFDEWEHILNSSPSYWKKLVRRAGQHASQQHMAMHQVLKGHKRICTYLEEHGRLRRPPRTKTTTRLEEVAYGCMRCRRACRTRAGEGAHMFKVHHEINPIRALFDTTTCGHCLKCYHTPVKLGAHLKKTTECRQHLVGTGHYFVPVPGSGSRIHQAQAKAHDGLLPHQQCAGPHTDSARRDDFHHFSATLCVLLAEYLADDLAATTEEAIAGLKGVIGGADVSWSTCKLTLQHLHDELRETDFEDMQLTLKDAQSILTRLQRVEEWPFLMQHREEEPHEDLNYWEKILQEGEPWTRTTTFSRQIGADRFILHAFSGKRRMGDFEFYLRQFPVPDGMRIHVVSVDVAIDVTMGDLMREDTRAFWHGAIRHRWVLGFLGGPPCETWSRARGKAIKGRKSAPRILRCEETLWGIPSMGLREHRQVHFGNSLLMFCLECLVLLLIYGGFGLLEHPAQPDSKKEQALASIWKLPIVTFLCSFAEVELHNLDQGLFGARSRKPTRILASIRLQQWGSSGQLYRS